MFSFHIQQPHFIRLSLIYLKNSNSHFISFILLIQVISFVPSLLLPLNLISFYQFNLNHHYHYLLHQPKHPLLFLDLQFSDTPRIPHLSWHHLHGVVMHIHHLSFCCFCFLHQLSFIQDCLCQPWIFYFHVHIMLEQVLEVLKAYASFLGFIFDFLQLAHDVLHLYVSLYSHLLLLKPCDTLLCL